MTAASLPDLDGADRAVLYLRSTAPRGLNERQRRALASLRVAARRGTLEAVEADVWSVPAATREVAPDDTPVAALLRQFGEWAEARDRQLGPAFAGVSGLRGNGADGAGARGGSTAPESVEVTSDPTAGVELPLCCVALFDGDEVVGVYPHADDGEVRTVEDCLDRLERTAAEPAEA